MFSLTYAIWRGCLDGSKAGFLPISVALCSERKNKPNPLKILFKMILLESSRAQSFHVIYLLYFSLHSFYSSKPGEGQAHLPTQEPRAWG